MKILLFLSCFSDGITLKMLDEALQYYPFLNLQKNWPVLIFLLSSMSLEDAFIDEDMFDSLSLVYMEQSSLGSSDYDIICDFIAKNDCFGESFLVFRKIKLFKADELFLFVHPRIRSILLKTSFAEIQVAHILSDVVRFHRIVSKSIVQALQVNMNAFEDVLDFSSLNKSVLWSREAKTSQELYLPSFLDEAETPVFFLKHILQFYQSSFTELFTATGNLSLETAFNELSTNEDNRLLPEFVEDLTDCALKILTAFRQCGFELETDEMVEVVRSLYLNNSKKKLLAGLICRIELFLIDFTFRSLKLSSSLLSQKYSFNTIWELCFSVEELIQSTFDDQYQRYAADYPA